ncbi:hypothetical protein KL918_004680 [Ogataea parapolymorpha]|nr:hypothetical protein KL918_004680 [Ogataea parapolymorpha]KAG7873883.1 hypothetical protein KL916_002043 [Ogataea parapolymorpha]
MSNFMALKHLVQAAHVAELAEDDDEGAEREGVAGNDPGGLRRRRVELLLQALGHGERGGDVEVVETRADENEDVGEVFGSVQRDH